MPADLNVTNTPATPTIDTTPTEGVQENQPKRTGLDQTNTFGSGNTNEGAKLSESMGLPAAVIKTAVDWASELMSLRSKTENAQLATSSENVKAIKDVKKTAANKRIAELDKMMKKLDEAAEKQKKASFWTKFAGFAMIAAGALLMLAGGAGAALIAAGAATLAVAALQESGALDTIMEGLTDFAMDAFDMSEEDARIFATAVVGAAILVVAAAATAVGGPMAGLAIATTALGALFTPENLVAMGVPEKDAAAVSLGISIGLAVAGFAGGGASMAGGTAKVTQLANQGSKLAKFAKFMAKGGVIQKLQAGMKNSQKLGELAMKYPKLATVLNDAQTFARFSSALAMGASGGATVASGVSTIEAAETTKEAKDIEAKTKEFEAFLAKMNAQFEDEKERIQEIMNRLEELASTVLSIMKGDQATTQKALAV